MAEIKKDSRPQQGPGRPGGGPGRGPGGRNLFVEKPKDFKGTIKKLFKYIKYKKGLFITLMVVMFLTTITGLLSPIIQKEVIDSLDKTNIDFGWDRALQYLMYLIIVYVITVVLSYFQQLISARLSQEIVKKIRNDLFSKFVKLPIKFLDTHSHGDLMSRMTNDVENISNTISQSIASLISGVMMIVGTFVIMVYYSWLLTLVSLVSVALTITVSKVLTGKMRKYFKAQSKILGELNGHSEEMITGYKTVVAYNKESKVIKEFNTISNNYTKTSILAQIWGGSMGPIMNFIGNFGYVSVTAVGAWLAISKPSFLPIMEIGTIALFLTCSKQFTRPINEIANLYGQILTATACAERVFEILESNNEIDKGTTEIDMDNFKGNIEFKNIDFGYISKSFPSRFYVQTEDGKYEYVTKLEENTPYKLGVNQENLNKLLFINGMMKEENAFTIDKFFLGLDVFVEYDLDNNIYLYTKKEGNKSYINAIPKMIPNQKPTYKLDLNPHPITKWAFNEEYNTIVTTIEDVMLYIGTYDNYKEVGVKKFKHLVGQKVLKNFTLSVKPGQKIALVGATGSGKTTVVNLLMRFYDVDSGEILLDGVNINDIPKDDLRNTIAIVLQDTVLFKDTIENNLKYGNETATFEEVKAAGVLSNSNYFVRNLPDKYNTVLSEGGSNLSQGQRQLLSIGRAVLANPKILILDEATSSVDTRTEKNIQDAMANLMANRTSLIIAHRLSTIQDADVIVVMDQGMIVEKGNHHELLELKGKYYNLYMTQFAGKEI